jgi:hypothetical protein
VSLIIGDTSKARIQRCRLSIFTRWRVRFLSGAISDFLRNGDMSRSDATCETGPFFLRCSMIRSFPQRKLLAGFSKNTAIISSLYIASIEAYVWRVWCDQSRSFGMEHDAHLAEDVDQARPGARIISLVIVFAALFGIAGYVFFGPGF